jgi:hypothetical protein
MGDFIGILEGKKSGPQPQQNITMTLNADTGEIFSGGNGKNGRIVLGEINKKEIVRLGQFIKITTGGGDVDAPEETITLWGLRIRGPNGTGERILMGADGAVILGGSGVDGGLTLNSINGKPSITVGGNKQKILIKNHDKSDRIEIGNQDIIIRNKNNKNETIHLYGEEGDIVLKDKQDIHSFGLHSDAILNSKSVAGLWIGASQAEASAAGKPGKPGIVVLRDTVGNDSIILNGIPGDNILVLDDLKRRVFAFANNSDQGRKAGLFIGAHTNDGGGKPGIFALRDFDGKDSIYMDGLNGDLFVKDNSGRNAFAFISDAFDNNVATLWIGADPADGGGKPGMIFMRDEKGKDSIIFDGLKGDILLNNADCAEEFDIVEEDEENVEPGMVMVIDKNGRLKPGMKAYDKRVAGVISGAGDFKPGIVLDRKHSQDSNRMPLALVGKVNCMVDADYSQIDVGDMLTTSCTPGHAMKATIQSKSFGAVIGKALKGIKSGRSLIPILIALQ